MTTRTTKKTVTFARPFTLNPLDEVLEPGDYEIEIDEELLGGLSFFAYRRLFTLVHLPAKAGHPGLTRTLSIDPNELDAAITRDAFLALGGADAAPPSVERDRNAAPEEDVDDQAVDRADDEGMIVHPRQNWAQSAPPSAPSFGPRSVPGLST